MDSRASDDESGAHGSRFHRFHTWLDGKLAVLGPEAVFIEAPLPPRAFHHADTARQLFGLIAITEMLCAGRDIGIVCEVNVASVKLFFTGSGRAEKSDMINECHRRGWRVQTDGEADACGLFAYGAASPDTARLWARLKA